MISVGYQENDDLYRELSADHPRVRLLGDARRVKNIMWAIWDAFLVAKEV